MMELFFVYVGAGRADYRLCLFNVKVATLQRYAIPRTRIERKKYGLSLFSAH